MSEALAGPVRFLSTDYTDRMLLIQALGVNWKSGISWVRTDAASLALRRAQFPGAGALPYLKKSMADEPKKEEIFYCRWICVSCASPFLFWRGRNFGTAEEVRKGILQGTDTDLQKLVQMALKAGFFADWLKTGPEGSRFADAFSWLQRRMLQEDRGYRKSLTMAYTEAILAENKIYRLEGKDYQDLESLAVGLQELADRMKLKMESVVRPMLHDECNLAPDLEGWLITLGHLAAVRSWDQAHLKEAPAGDTAQQAGETDFSEDELPGGASQQPGPLLPADEDEAQFLAEGEAMEPSLAGFLAAHREILADSARLEAVLMDLYPDRGLHTRLLMLLHRMDIVPAMDQVDEIGSVFVGRFVSMLMGSFGIRESYSLWAVRTWCLCYGSLYGKTLSIGELT